MVKQYKGKKLYKVLLNNKSNNGGNRTWKLGKWTPKINDVKICEKGYHLTTKPYKWFNNLNCEVYEAEADKIIDIKDDKIVCSSARIIKKVQQPRFIKLVKQFIETIPKNDFFSMKGEPKKEWKLFLADDWGAARDAAYDAVLDAVWSAAKDAASDAAWSAARNAARNAAYDAARGAARDAAWSAARDTAYDAARNAALDAAWDVAGDAALMAELLIIDGLYIPKKHINHIFARWDVWRRGYGLLCDINGVLYVYGINKNGKEK